jgi:hypothetical protein
MGPMTLNAEALYMQLGRLIQTMPDLESAGEYPTETQMWLARAYALVLKQGNVTEAIVEIKSPSDNATQHTDNTSLEQRERKAAAGKIVAALYRALAVEAATAAPAP